MSSRSAKTKALHQQLRREVLEMKYSGDETADSEGVHAPAPNPVRRGRAPKPPRRRFVPMRPRNYVSSDELRIELQRRVSGEEPQQTITDTPGQWWRDL